MLQMKQMLSYRTFASIDWNMFRDSSDGIADYTTDIWFHQ
jgi:hypothetical protein